MVRKQVTLAAFVSLVPASVFAQDDVMAGYFGNTVVSTGSLGESHTRYKADHTFDVTFMAFGQTFNGKGTWTIDGNGELCRTYDQPPAGITNPVCTPIQPHKPGDKWTVTFDGKPRNVTMMAGTQ